MPLRAAYHPTDEPSHVSRLIATLAFVVGCGTSRQTTELADAPSTLSYHVGVFSAEPQDRAPPTVAPTVYIDGVLTSSLDVTYATPAAALGDAHRVQLRYGSEVVAEMLLLVNDNGCLSPTSFTLGVGICSYYSGDLRYGDEESLNVVDNGRVIDKCHGDSFCFARCACAADQRCAPRVVSITPFASHLACTPIGPKQAGDSCAFLPRDGDGAYDDCGADLVCVGGTCQALCAPGVGACATCDYVPGYPPEIRICH